MITVSDKALRAQAVLLTEVTYRKMKTTPTVPQEKVSPIVYDLLLAEVPVAHIEMALLEAKALTRAGIDYILRTLVPSQSGMKPIMAQVKPVEWDAPTEEQKAHAAREIAKARAALHPEP